MNATANRLITILALLFILFPAQNDLMAQRAFTDGTVNHTVSYSPNTIHASEDLEVIRKRIVSDLLKPPIAKENIAKLVSTIRKDGSWPGINYKDVSRTGFEHRIHLEHMLELSRAYRRPGSAYYNDPAVKKTISAAMDFWIKNDFICDNWWWNEMGTPNLMINTLLVMDTALNEHQRKEGARIANRANMQAHGARPGGDLIQIAGMYGKQGLFLRNDAILDTVVKVMAEEIKITTDRGIKPDLSFHHRVDNVISTLTYGTGYASAFSYWAVKIAGTKYRLPESSTRLLIDYYLDGICKSLIYGKYPDPGAKNRDLSRPGTLEPLGTEIPENLMQASDYRKKELEEIVKIRKNAIKPNLTGNRFFWHSEYFTHQRPAYFASVRMHSSRNNNMEQPHNEEGLKNHHFADGSTFISRTGKEYFDIFPVWDWQKIPGTTVVQKPALPPWREIAKKGLTDFVGGVSDGKYGVAAFDFISQYDPLKARKSWFFFDKEYVCLGTGISSQSEYPVATTINQSLLNKDVVIYNGKAQVKADKGNHRYENVSWVFHDSVAYIFPSAIGINVSNQAATGNWRSINHQSFATEEPVTAELFTCWIDHGQRPEQASYSYIVVPNISPSTIDGYRKKNDIVILSNTPDLQAVTSRSLNMIQAVFYNPGKLSISKDITLTAGDPCIVMVVTNGKTISEIAVSDPTQKLAALTVQVTGNLDGMSEKWSAEWNRDSNTTTIYVQLPLKGYAGQTVVIKPVKKKV